MTAISAASATESDSPETANPFPDLAAINGPDASPQLPHPRGPAPRSYPRPRFGDYSRTRFESRVAFGGPDEDEDAEDEFIAASTRKFSVWEIMSGLPDDSREEDERAAERRLRDLRGRVKAARAVVSRTPGLAYILLSDWTRAARFYARWGITERQVRIGVPTIPIESRERDADFGEQVRISSEADRVSRSNAGFIRPRPVAPIGTPWANRVPRLLGERQWPRDLDRCWPRVVRTL
jgi:hypothetical protein